MYDHKKESVLEATGIDGSVVERVNDILDDINKRRKEGEEVPASLLTEKLENGFSDRELLFVLLTLIRTSLAERLGV